MIHYDIVYSHRRKTIAIRIMPDARVRVSAPYATAKAYIDKFVQSKQSRIQSKISLVKNHTPQTAIAVSREMKAQALVQILPRVEYYAEIMDLTHRYSDIKITVAQTKRGSCSSKGVLMFHRKLSQVPTEILDYVVVHELAHLVHFNHSPDFWHLVGTYYPRYPEAKKRLQSYHTGIIIQ